jgi:hypothetical protein
MPPDGPRENAQEARQRLRHEDVFLSEAHEDLVVAFDGIGSRQPRDVA